MSTPHVPLSRLRFAWEREEDFLIEERTVQVEKGRIDTSNFTEPDVFIKLDAQNENGSNEQKSK